MKELIETYLKKNPDLRDNLRPGSETQLIEKLSQNYTERAGEIVNVKTNLAIDNPGNLIRQFGREFLKSRGEGKYIPRYADRRTTEQREKDKAEFKKLLTEYSSRLPNKYVSPEPERILINEIANNFLYEKDGKGGFNIVSTINGIPIERHSPDKVFARLNKYLDPDKTKIEEKKLEARLRNNALDLEGYTLSDLNDLKKKQIVDNTIQLLKKDLYSIPTEKKLPSIKPEDFDSDLMKQGAHEAGLPLDEGQWSLSERIKLNAYATEAIERKKTESFEGWERFTRERTPDFYKSVYEKFSGLEY